MQLFLFFIFLLVACFWWLWCVGSKCVFLLLTPWIGLKMDSRIRIRAGINTASEWSCSSFFHVYVLSCLESWISFRLWESAEKNPGSPCSCLSAWTPTVKVIIPRGTSCFCQCFSSFFCIKSSKKAGNFWWIRRFCFRQRCIFIFENIHGMLYSIRKFSKESWNNAGSWELSTCRNSYQTVWNLF